MSFHLLRGLGKLLSYYSSKQWYVRGKETVRPLIFTSAKVPPPVDIVFVGSNSPDMMHSVWRELTGSDDYNRPEIINVEGRNYRVSIFQSAKQLKKSSIVYLFGYNKKNLEASLSLIPEGHKICFVKSPVNLLNPKGGEETPVVRLSEEGKAYIEMLKHPANYEEVTAVLRRRGISKVLDASDLTKNSKDLQGLLKEGLEAPEPIKAGKHIFGGPR